MVDYKKMQPMQQRKVLNVFNEQAFERLGVENGVNLVGNFAGYRGLQTRFEASWRSGRYVTKICEAMNLHLTGTIEKSLSTGYR